MCIRIKIVSSVVVLFLFSPIFITDSYEIDCSNERSLILDNDNFDNENKIFNKAENLLANTPRAFTENHGQLENDEVLFYDQGGAVWFTADGAWFEIREEIKGQESGVSDRELEYLFGPINKMEHPNPTEYKRVILKQEFVGANKVLPIGCERLSWNSNFFYGNDSTKWCTNVPNYAEVWYENIYDGIDLRYYTNNNGLKYDFIVHPGANIEQIRIRYAGADKLDIDKSANLIIKTKLKNFTEYLCIATFFA